MANGYSTRGAPTTTCAARYPPSPRRFPERLPAVQYEPGVAVRKVSDRGTVHFKGQAYPIGKALKTQYVVLRATTKDREYAVYYCTNPSAN